MPVKGGPNIRTNQAIIWLDSADKSSYPGAGTTWVNSVTPGTNNGTLNNTSFNPTDALGALFFSGSNTFADMGNIGAISSSYTFQVAVKPVSAPSPYTILSYTSGSGTGSVTFRLDYSSSIQTAVFSAFANSGSVNKTYNLSTTIPTGSWSILHGRFNGFALALFKNGSFINSTIITGSVVSYSTNNRFLVGGVSQFTGSYLSGSVANVAMYSTSLSSYFITTNYNGLATRFGLPTTVTPNVDEDVQAFLEATGITNPTEISAIINLVTDLKNYNLWNKMQAIYPFVGGTATTHKYNLKDPRDTDNAFRVQFFGNVTHNNLGVSASAAGYGDTRFIPTTSFANISSSIHVAIQISSRPVVANEPFNAFITDYEGNGYAGGTLSIATAGNPLGITNTAYAHGSYDAIGYSISSLGGLYISTRTTLAQMEAYKRSFAEARNVSGGSIFQKSSPNSNTIRLFRGYITNNYTTGVLYQYASIGTGLIQTDADNLYILLTSFNNTLGRS